MDARIQTLTRLLLGASLGLAGLVRAEMIPKHETVEPAIVVWVYNYAPEAESALPRARQEATRIFSKAGVSATWVDCFVGQAHDPGCDGPSSPADIQLRILPAQRDEQFGDALGYALPEEGAPGSQRMGGGYGVYATVFYGAVVRRARASEYASSSQMLGSVIAHEIGHLLLGRNSHTSQGLMNARWSNADLRGIAGNGLSFSRQESRRILEGIQARMTASRRQESAPGLALREGVAGTAGL